MPEYKRTTECCSFSFIIISAEGPSNADNDKTFAILPHSILLFGLNVEWIQSRSI